MYIEEVEDQIQDHSCSSGNSVVVSDAKRVLLGAAARALFYPTLLYNVVRNKIQSEFRWWDRVDELILLGAVPFPADVPRLRELGVSGVVTLNEPYETLVPASLYHSLTMIDSILDSKNFHFVCGPCGPLSFRRIYRLLENASLGKTTYVHCKAGRGRSTTIVLCYLVEHRQMAPDSAYEYVRSIRPRVLLASSQWQAVQEYYHIKVKKTSISDYTIVEKYLDHPAEQDNEAFDDDSVVIVTESDLDGYEASCDSSVARNEMLSVRCLNLSLACKVQFASQATAARLSCLWLRCLTDQKTTRKKLGNSVNTDQLASISVDIQVY